jgi:hypothetical protein
MDTQKGGKRRNAPRRGHDDDSEDYDQQKRDARANKGSRDKRRHDKNRGKKVSESRGGGKPKDKEVPPDPATLEKTLKTLASFDTSRVVIRAAGQIALGLADSASEKAHQTPEQTVHRVRHLVARLQKLPRPTQQLVWALQVCNWRGIVPPQEGKKEEPEGAGVESKPAPAEMTEEERAALMQLARQEARAMLEKEVELAGVHYAKLLEFGDKVGDKDRLMYERVLAGISANIVCIGRILENDRSKGFAEMTAVTTNQAVVVDSKVLGVVAGEPLPLPAEPKLEKIDDMGETEWLYVTSHGLPVHCQAWMKQAIHLTLNRIRTQILLTKPMDPTKRAQQSEKVFDTIMREIGPVSVYLCNQRKLMEFFQDTSVHFVMHKTLVERLRAQRTVCVLSRLALMKAKDRAQRDLNQVVHDASRVLRGWSRSEDGDRKPDAVALSGDTVDILISHLVRLAQSVSNDVPELSDRVKQRMIDVDGSRSSFIHAMERYTAWVASVRSLRASIQQFRTAITEHAKQSSSFSEKDDTGWLSFGHLYGGHANTLAGNNIEFMTPTKFVTKYRVPKAWTDEDVEMNLHFAQVLFDGANEGLIRLVVDMTEESSMTKAILACGVEVEPAKYVVAVDSVECQSTLNHRLDVRALHTPTVLRPLFDHLTWRRETGLITTLLAGIFGSKLVSAEMAASYTRTPNPKTFLGDRLNSVADDAAVRLRQEEAAERSRKWMLMTRSAREESVHRCFVATLSLGEGASRVVLPLGKDFASEQIGVCVQAASYDVVVPQLFTAIKIYLKRDIVAGCKSKSLTKLDPDWDAKAATALRANVHDWAQVLPRPVNLQ